MTFNPDNLLYLAITWLVVSVIACIMHKWNDLRLKHLAEMIEQEKRHHEQLTTLKAAQDKHNASVRDTITRAEHVQAMAQLASQAGGEYVNIDGIEPMRQVLAGTHRVFEGMPDDMISEIQDDIVSHVMSMDVAQGVQENHGTEMVAKVMDRMKRARKNLQQYDLTMAMLELRSVAELHPKLTVLHESTHRLRLRYLEGDDEQKVGIRQYIDELCTHFGEGDTDTGTQT